MAANPNFDFAAAHEYAEDPAHQGAHGPDNDFNGFSGKNEIALPVSFIADSNKLVLNTDGGVDFRGSVAVALYHAQNAPGVDTEVSQAHIAAAATRIGILLAQYEFLAVMYRVQKVQPAGAAAAGLAGGVPGPAPAPPAPPAALDENVSGVKWEFRKSDLIPADKFTELTADAVGGAAAGKMRSCSLAANALWTWLHEDDARLARAMPDAASVTYTIVANYLHRKQLGDHNWLTGDTEKAKTQTGKIVKIAAEWTATFKAFLLKWGHDIWHFLSTPTMDWIVEAMCGVEGADMYAAVGVIYGGRDVSRMRVVDIMHLNDAAKDRVPVGTIGVSALVIGVQYLGVMLRDLMLHAVVDGDLNYNPIIVELTKKLKTTTLSRDQLTKARDTLGPAVVFALGYVGNIEEFRTQIREFASLTGIRNANLGDGSAGATLQKYIRNLDVETVALGAAITGSLQIMKDAFIAFAAETGVPLTAPTAVPKVTVNATQDDYKRADNALAASKKAKDQGTTLQDALSAAAGVKTT